MSNQVNRAKPSIYIVQFGTGTNINLLPLSAGQLFSRIKNDPVLFSRVALEEIVFRRPETPEGFARQLKNALVVGFSCFSWNVKISLQCAEAVRARFPEALIVLGGPSIPKDQEYSPGFMRANRFVDVICIDEGEEVFAELCQRRLEKQPHEDVCGIIFRGRNGDIGRTKPEPPDLRNLPSPYVDGTFDELYAKYQSEFSGVIWETNRGCPYSCTYCTWGHLPSKVIREKPISLVEKEVEWIGRHKIRYIAMCDSNFGIRKRDIQVAGLLAESKRKYGYPEFISVSWVKNSSDKVINVSKILKECGIGFRVTLSLQSLNPSVIRAVKRSNTSQEVFDRIKGKYRNDGFYSYTELILGLPMETRESFLNGIEECLSDSLYDQVYVYPCFLFPNTELGSRKSRHRYGLISRLVPNRYTKSKEIQANEELVEIVTGTAAMPPPEWVNSFVLGYYILGIYGDRLAFFILNYLKRECGIRIVDLLCFARAISQGGEYPVLKRSFLLLQRTAQGVQEEGRSHLIEPEGFGLPYDPPEGLFLELLVEKDSFYCEFHAVVCRFLEEAKTNFDRNALQDLFKFQNAVMAHPAQPSEFQLELNYNWVEYNQFGFNRESKRLTPGRYRYTVIDPQPCLGNRPLFLKRHFDVRGVPSFNRLNDQQGREVFPSYQSTQG